MLLVCRAGGGPPAAGAGGGPPEAGAGGGPPEAGAGVGPPESGSGPLGGKVTLVADVAPPVQAGGHREPAASAVRNCF